MSAFAHVNKICTFNQKHPFFPFFVQVYILRLQVLVLFDGMPVVFLNDDRKKAHG